VRAAAFAATTSTEAGTRCCRCSSFGREVQRLFNLVIVLSKFRFYAGRIVLYAPQNSPNTPTVISSPPTSPMNLYQGNATAGLRHSPINSRTGSQYSITSPSATMKVETNMNHPHQSRDDSKPRETLSRAEGSIVRYEKRQQIPVASSHTSPIAETER
jgi:hypothetical protein